MIDTILIKVAYNVLHKFVYAYEFKNLKVINYSLYNLDNQTDAPCQITVNFAFESFREYVPNGKVEAAPIDLNKLKLTGKVK